jgi:hypothetical protein
MTIVTFEDKIVKKEITYSIPKNLIKVWEGLSEKVIKQNSDRVYIITGKERSGKSTFAFQQAKYIDPTFNVYRICFSPEQFLEQIRTAKKGSVVVFDEAFRGFSSKASLSKVNKLLVQSMMEVGKRNLIIFIILPVFTLLEPYIAISRSYALFIVFRLDKRGKKYRGWRCYTENKKAKIYYKAKKDFGIIPYTKTILRGEFYSKVLQIGNKEERVPYETFQLEEYEHKKDLAFSGKTQDNDNDGDKMTLQRRIFLTNLYLLSRKQLKYTKDQFLSKLSQVGIEMKTDALNYLVDKTKKEGKLMWE